MGLAETKRIIESSENIPVITGDAIDDRLVIPELAEAYREPPGAFVDFMAEIRDNFERRYDGDVYRIVGAIGLAQAIVGPHIKGPTGSKCAFGTFVASATGSGKGAPNDFVRAYAEKLGISMRVSESIMSSTKQIQMRLIEAGGSLLYIADDCPKHLKSWSSPSGNLSDMDEFFRSSSTGSYSPTTTIRIAFSELLEKRMNPKSIVAASRREGWNIPRIRVGYSPDENGETPEGPIDYAALAKMPHRTGIEIRRLLVVDELLKQESIKNARFIPLISITPDSAPEIIRSWTNNGGMGRMLFISGHDELPALRMDVESVGQVNMRIIHEWQSRIPDKDFTVGFRSDEAKARCDFLRLRIDDMRNEPGITGVVATRYGQLMIDLATLCAWFDFSARNGDTAAVDIRHLDWAFSMVVKSMRSLRDFMEGEADFDGLEQTEWNSILGRVRKIIESPSFKGYISALANKLCRDRVEMIIRAAESVGMKIDARSFSTEVMRAIAQSERSPVRLHENGRSIVIDVDKKGSWDGIKMTQPVIKILSNYVNKTKFTRRK